jgi:hypothetical protein
VNSGEQGGEMKQKKKKRKREGLTCGGCNHWLYCWRRQAAALVLRGGCNLFSLSLFFFFIVLVFRPFSLFFFFFSFLSVLLPLPSLLPSSLLVVLSTSVFIGKIGERKAGAATVLSPKNYPRNTSSPFSPTRGKLWARLVGVFLRERWRWKEVDEKRDKSSLPCFLHVQGKKKTYSVIQNGTVFCPFFLMNSG